MSDGFLRFTCSSCGKGLKALPSQAGISATCPKCKSSMRVPGGINAVTPPPKTEIIPASHIPTMDRRGSAVAPLPALEDDDEPAKPQVVVIRQETQHTREIVRYADAPKKKKKDKGPSSNMLLILYMLTGGGAVATAMICTWFIGLPLLVMSLILGGFLWSKHKSHGGVIACVIVSAVGILIGGGLGVMVVIDSMAREREYEREWRWRR